MSNIKYSSKRGTASKIKRTVKRPIKKLFLFLNSKSPQLRSVYKEMKLFRRRKRFEKYSNISVDNKLIVFESFTGLKYADSPKAIYEYMLNSSKYEDYHFIWTIRGTVIDDYQFLENNDRTTVIQYGTENYYRTFATAGYWISNSRIVNALVPRDGQVYVQCWHGTPLKRLAYDIEVSGQNDLHDKDDLLKLYSIDASKYTHMISPSAFCTEKFTSAFNLKALGKQDIFIEEGYPRNDFLNNFTADDVDRVRNALNIPSDKKIILYAPTWRDNQHVSGTGYVFENPIDFDKMRELFADEYVVVFRPHYFIANEFDFAKYEGFVFDAALYPEINDLYIIADVLITDYSSVFFDYSILRRPILFYMYDLEQYQDTIRGFYISLDDLPGPIVVKEDDLFDKIRCMDEWSSSEEYRKKYEVFSDRFTYLDDGKASERVVKRIFG